MEQTIRGRLEELADEQYRIFASSLIPGCDNMLGVRIPQIRKLAKQIAKEEPIAYLHQGSEEFFEELMLKGLILGNLRENVETVLEEAARFIPKISNWSVCDSFCAELKIARKAPQRVWEFLQPYWQSNRTYEIRFAVVMMRDHYVTEAYLMRMFSIFDQIRHPDHYVKMAVAWAVSECFVKFPEETMKYLQHNQLDRETYNKSLQKIRESTRVAGETKQRLKSMKQP